MKRSRHLRLVLLGSAPLLLAGCSHDDSSREGVYTSVDSCTAATHDARTCQQAYAEARNQARMEAPRFDSLADCELDYGKQSCQTQESGGHAVFMPMLTGFLLSQALRNGQPQGAPSTAPAFRDRSGQWFRAPASCASGAAPNANGSCSSGSGSGSHFYGRGTGTVSRPPLQAIELPADRAVTVSRGGFGDFGAHGGGGE